MGPRDRAHAATPATAPPTTPPTGLRRRTVPWAVLGLWVVALALLAPLAGKLGDVQRDRSVDYLPASADSTRAAELREALPGGDTTDLVLVYQRDGGLTDADRALAGDHLERIAQRYPLAGDAPAGIPSRDGGTAMYPVSLATDGDDEERTAAVEYTRDLVEPASGNGLTVQVGGSGALGADSEAVFESIDSTLMMATAGVVALLLVITYRSPILWLLPLVSVGAAAGCSMAVVYVLVRVFDITVTSMSASIMTVLVFGAGTDYALLLVARYREELRRHRRPQDAMLAALRGCGPAVLASSGTVAVGLLCLLAADLNSSSGLGPVGAVGVVCALAAMTTLLPAILVLLGRRVFWPFVPEYGSQAPGADRRGFFDRMGGSVDRRPVAVLTGGVLLLGVLALGILNLPGALKTEDTFTEKPDSVVAMETLAEAYPERGSQPITVLARTDHASRVVERAAATDGVVDATAGRSGGGWSEISVIAEGAPGSPAERETIRELRAALHPLDGAEASVGGESAQQWDMEATNHRDRVLVVPLVLAAVLLILVALLRSVIAPVVLLAAVVASWAAALGVGGLVFGPVFGFDGFEAGLPLLTFVFSVALGVDYGIFLMHRMREEALGGADTRQAALTALARTGGVIASAGVVLAATFAVLATMPLVMMVEIGFVVAVGVLLDTFLVRTYLVTSSSVLLGRWVWWPGPLHRRPRTAAGDGQRRPGDHPGPGSAASLGPAEAARTDREP